MIVLRRRSACWRRASEELKTLERDVAKLENVQAPFPWLHYDDAIKLIQSQGLADAVGQRLRRHRRDGDRRGLRPAGGRAPLPGRDQGVLHGARPRATRSCSLSADILAPEGYGEIVGGGERMSSGGAAAAAHPRAQAARGGVPLVPRPAASTAACRTPASAWASSASSPGSAASSTCARRSPSRACCTGSIPSSSYSRSSSWPVHEPRTRRMESRPTVLALAAASEPSTALATASARAVAPSTAAQFLK